jgi:transportin-1
LPLTSGPAAAQVFDEYDEEVGEAEAAEAATSQAEDRDQDLRPFQHRAR